MKRSRSFVEIQDWKDLFISSVVSFDSSHCLCSKPIHSVSPDESLFSFVSSNRLICTSKFVSIFFRLYPLPDSFFISYDPDFKSSLKNFDLFIHNHKDDIIDDDDENLLLDDYHRALIVSRIVEYGKNKVNNNWYYNYVLEEEEDLKIPKSHYEREDSANLVKQICQVSFIPSFVPPLNFSVIHNPYFEFYKNCLFVFCYLLCDNYSSPRFVTYNPKYSIDFWVSNNYISRYIDMEFLNLSDFCLLFREFIFDCLKYSKLFYYYYEILQLYSDPERDYKYDHHIMTISKDIKKGTSIFDQLVNYIKKNKGEEFVKGLGYDK